MMQVGLLALGLSLVAWEGWRQTYQAHELAEIEAQIGAAERESESRRSALAAAEQRNRQAVDDEGRAGNQGLLALMRERAAVAKSASEATTETRTFGNALAGVLDSADQKQADKKYLRDQMRASLELFFKMTKLSPEKMDQYLDMEIDAKQRDSDRLAALLRGSMSVADALSQRDEDRSQEEAQRREILGPDGQAFFDSIADGMRNESAKQLVGAIQQNMGNAALSQEQSDKLQGLIKTQVATDSMDNTDLFRPPAEWTQMVSDHEQAVVQGAAAFLTPDQDGDAQVSRRPGPGATPAATVTANQGAGHQIMARQRPSLRIMESVQTCCGYAVPVMEFKERRQTLKSWAEKKGPDGVREYRQRKNSRSIDGLPTGVTS